MPSEQKQLFFDEKQATLRKDYDMKSDVVDTIRSVVEPKISESDFHYKLKNVKIDLPKINIPNEVLLKHEVDKYRKLFQHKPQTARKSVGIKAVSCVGERVLFRKSEKVEEEGIKMSAKILSFSCLKCRDSTRYSPNDLQKHFQMWHHGELPSYPCEMCSFSANDFQAFKQHRRTHRSTLVKCDICNNENVYTLLDLTKHFVSTHCVNGSFQCEKCKFSTLDVGTFVQHIHRHNEIHYKSDKYHHIYFTRGEIQKHLHVHSVKFPFTCQYCNYGASRREHLVRHVLTLHKEHLYAKEKLEKDKYEKKMAKTSVGLKLILKRYKIGASRKTFWKRKKIHSGSDQILEKNTEVVKKVNKTQAKSEGQSHLIQDHLNEKDERLHCESNDKPGESESEKPTILSTGQHNRAEELSNSTSGFLKTAVQGPTVLMVKNNRITVPANYSAKFMGFKMVDGKQHIVIKLLPTNKENLYSSGSQSDGAKDSTANLKLQTLDTTGFLTRGTTDLSDTVYMKATTFSCSPPILPGKVTSEKEMALLSQTSNTLQTGDDEKSVSSFPTSSELITSSVNFTTKVETRDNVDLLGSHITHSYPEVSGTAMKSPDKINSATKSNAYNSGDMHNYCINYVNSESPVESSKQGSLPFHNYSKVNNSNKRWRSSGTATCESPQRESSSSKTVVQQPISASVLSLVRKESSNPDSMLASISLLNAKDETLKAQVDIEEQSVLEEGQNIDGQNLYINENQNLESMTEKSKWDDISSVESPLMPRITSVFSLQSKQASEFLPPEINQLLQDVLKTKPDVKQDSSNTLDKGLSGHCDQSFQKHEGEGKIIESSKDFRVQGIFPIPSGSMGINVPTNDLNLKCSGKETQMLSVSQDVKDLEKTPRISGIGTLLKTQSDAIITQQLVKDKLRATTQNLGSLYMPSPLVNSEPKKAIFVQTPKGFFVPLHIANKPGLHVVSGKPQVNNNQGAPASLLLNKKPGMILTFNNGKFEGVNTVKSESSQACGTTTKEPCRMPFLKVEPNNNCLTPALCSSIGSCLSMKSSSENTLPLKGPYIIKTPSSSSVKAVPTFNIIPEHRGAKSNVLNSVKQQREIFPKPPLFTLLPDGKQTVFLKCVMPNKTELLKPKLVQNSTYYKNIQPKKPEGTPQKILLKIFNPVLNVTAANNLSVSNSASSLQKDNVSSNQTAGGGQKEPESSRDALPFLDDMMPANEIVITSTATCPESSEEPVHITDGSEARVLRYKTNCTIERSFNRKKTSKKNISRIKAHVRSRDSETASVSRSRNCKRKCRDSYLERPRKKATLHRKCKEKVKPEDVHESFGFCTPRLSKDSVRTLRLFPFSSKQLVTCPRRNQPVVVLNHPDADAPEVVNVMKTISKFNGRVLKVSLSKRTINALLKPVCYNPSKTTYGDFSKRHKTYKPVCSVKERFVLKLTLKKTSKNNYQIVKTTSENVLKAKFNCWFCGRVFDNQDAWAGHGQRHLMEATRDWNMLE
ncbi:zinc finger protein 518A [Phyllostomus discolor]|uniref:Zinc finger protein 518A n=1 Tax=Phyllostomus discolor TaxID=89673 RepID=A0A6J2LJY8_9CHIR|nr:zinc finger protein 518A [Phyllostomus discolor]XP_035882967.1 zinc finger protein 518A [Phyllostomus discolor]XP_035882968.1 zinc finger protein 518A [Phyllostomus discolor]XP_035882969.1 zinc finger protein 518A [Phyllostomus discolor]XP_035882970.1 zinc finger protein 518A [Phyllostomus discolor]XP_035882971.1 zinc finger protein 518A [Phyllostomus discolor]XP_035882972.1 zinc finger protein 518A [Phyllostomus discolor]XP_035882974.1 zinc finger protein 518A [Phyllostomus discolor]KAF